MKIHRCFCWSLVTLRLVSVHHAGDGPQAEVLIHATEQSAPIVLPYGVRVVDGTILHPLDIDLFEFTAEAEDRVRIRIATESSTLDPRYELRDSQNGLHDSWASTAGATGTTFQRELVLHSAGQYRISLEDRDRNDIGDYTIQFERIPPRTTERVIGYDRLVNDTIDHKLDLDAFRVELEVGKAVRIAVSTSEEGLDPFYELYDPTGLRVDSWAATSGPTGCTFVRDILPALSGTYRLLVSDRDLDDTGDYSVFINCLTASCPPTAMEVVRNGTGVNPLAYTAVSPAVLGGVLGLRVDASSGSGATRAFV